MTISPITIAHVTDLHLLGDPDQEMLGINTNEHAKGVLSHISASQEQPVLLLTTGDIAQDGSDAAYLRFMDMAKPLGIPVHALPGNHDKLGHFSGALGPVTTPVIDIGAWRIIMLNSSIPDEEGGHLAEDQLALLEAAAQVEDGRHVLVAMHHNPVLMHSTWLDTMTIDNKGALFTLLARLPKVRALLWGHVHQEYDATEPHPSPAGHLLSMMATPATCFQFRPKSHDFGFDDAAPGYRWIKLYPDGKIDTHVVRVTSLTRRPHTHITGY